MVKEIRHAAKIKIPEKVLLELLQLPGGKIHRVCESDDWLPDNIIFLIEHPDLDEVSVGAQLRIIDLVLEVTAKTDKEGTFFKFKRIEPPVKPEAADGS